MQPAESVSQMPALPLAVFKTNTEPEVTPTPVSPEQTTPASPGPPG